MVKRLLCMLLILSAGAWAGDRTPYRFTLGGNGYSSPDNYGTRWSIKQCIEKYDGNLAGDIRWGSTGWMQRLYDTAGVYKPAFRNYLGLYCGPHEINLYESNPGLSYAERMTDITDHWYYIYATHYLDSLKALGVPGADPESLVVHIMDNAYSYSVLTEGTTRTVADASGLNMSEKRWTYQYWNNNAGDTFSYPAGYCWTVNGANTLVAQAIRYAYRRHLREDAASLYGGPMTAGFYDNCQDYADVLGKYWTHISSSGGPTSGMDWYECYNITNADSALAFVHRSHDHIFAELVRELSPEGYYGVANAPVENTTVVGYLLDSTNAVSFEGYVDPGSKWQNWRYAYKTAQLCRARLDNISGWAGFCDYSCSSDPSSWKYDSVRMYAVPYGTWLTFMDTNFCFTPLRYFNDSARWIGTFETDFGLPYDAPTIIATNHDDYGITSGWPNSYTPGDYDVDVDAVIRRKFDNGNVQVYVRSAAQSSNFTGDYYTVTPGGTWYRLDLKTGVFGTSPITSFTMRPYECVIIANQPAWSGPYYGSAPGTFGEASGEEDPQIQLSPSSFTFSGIVGGSNPANQTMMVYNVGGGTLNWTSADDATWLSINPTTGTAPTATSVIVNTTGLTAGTHIGHVVIYATGADNSPQSATVTLTMTNPVTPTTKPSNLKNVRLKGGHLK